jgi:hypothetical protein
MVVANFQKLHQGGLIMLPHPVELLKRESVETIEWHVPEVRGQLDSLEQWVAKSAHQGVSAYEVERGLFDGLLRLGNSLFGAFLKLVGPGDVGETAALDDGRVVSRLLELHTRHLRTVFGRFDISRHVYAQRDGQKIELAPADQRLQLPESDLSYLLQEWDQMLGIEHAFGKVRDTLDVILRLKQSVDTIERNNQQMAEPVLSFHESQPPIDLAKEAELLVVTEDNKGIPMVRPPEQKPVGAHRRKGEKANKKQMACIGCVYSVDPHARTPEELVATLFRDPERPKVNPPKAKQKRYWAELTRSIADIEIRGQDLVFIHMGHEIEHRRRANQVLIHLCDGQPSLLTDRLTFLPTDQNTVEILDLMHAISRLWVAAHLFHDEGSKEASAFVRERLLRVLNGEVASVVHGLRYLGTVREIKGAKLTTLTTACNFLKANEHRMHYDEYLKAGYPIATGVIEGACRHVIKDRMERAGMRWQVPGAQAMLSLRAVNASGDWEAYQNYRMERENQRLYKNNKVLKDIAWPFTLAV